MFYVTSLNGALVEPLFNISDDFKMEQSVNGDFQISFTCFPGDKNPGYDLLGTESVITVDGFDFKVKRYSNDKFSKNVVATSVYFENIKKQKQGLFLGVHTLRNQLNFALSGTGWSAIIEIDPDTNFDIANRIVFIKELGNTNVVSLVNTICQTHDVEYQILTGNRIRVKKRIGEYKDYQYRYKHNISSVVLTEDTTNLYTYIRGYGADGIETSYTSFTSVAFGILEAEPIRDTRFTNVESLRNYLQITLRDVPELAIETTIPELTERDIGESIWLIYEPLNIEMQTRILKQTKVLINGNLVTSSVLFGNTLNKTSVDILVEQQEGIKDNAENLNETKEDLAETKSNFTSEITTTNDRITLSVQELNTSISAVDIKADQIDISVSNLANNTQSSINLLSDNINLKIDRGGAITDINLSPGNATINADKINLNGAVFVNGMITGSTSIEVNTDVILGRQLRFSDFTALTTGGGNLTLEAFNNIDYTATTHYFNGIVDFRNATVVGI